MNLRWLKYLCCLLPAIIFLVPGTLLGYPKAPFIWPLQGEVITGFRQKYWDIEKARYYQHTGIDIKAEPGSQVKASANGLVSYKGISPVGGLTVVIRHNQRIRTTYLNLSKALVSKGAFVTQGQDIGIIGAKDDPSSHQPHLHFGVIYQQGYLDPQDLLSIDYHSISRFIFLDYIKDDYRLSPGY